MIIIKAAPRNWLLKWTGKVYRDEAGHIWKLDSTGTKFNSATHGTFLDFKEKVIDSR